MQSPLKSRQMLYRLILARTIRDEFKGIDQDLFASFVDTIVHISHLVTHSNRFCRQ
jgi:hypothetical protein